MARACLTQEEFLLWMDIHKNLAQKELSKMSEKKKKKRGMKELTYEMFIGIGEWFEETTQQKNNRGRDIWHQVRHELLKPFKLQNLKYLQISYLTTIL
jgi:hypothetical protein